MEEDNIENQDPQYTTVLEKEKKNNKKKRSLTVPYILIHCRVTHTVLSLHVSSHNWK
jgi:hypothetical protein